MLASGPLKGTALRAGFLILKADSLQEAQALIEADPFTREDLICGLSIEQWDPLFGMLAEYSSKQPRPNWHRCSRNRVPAPTPGKTIMLYELTTLHCSPLAQDRVSNAAHAWVQQCSAALLGAWRADIGDLFQIKLLRAFDSAQTLEAERQRARLHPMPFGVDAANVHLKMESLAPFPFLAPLQTGERGAVYEFRTYWLQPGGLAPTIAAWQAAMDPAAEYTQHLLINMYALDGPPRIVHIWGFESLAQRQELRARHYALGLQQIARANSTICVPEAYSPIH